MIASYLGLGDEEVGVDEGAGAEAAPDVEDLGAEVALVLVHHVGRDDGDDAIPEPVARRRERHAARAHRQRVQLADQHPRAGSPRAREEEDVDADEESSNSMSMSKESREESEGAGDRGNPSGADVKEGRDVESCLSLVGLSGASTLVMTVDAGELDFAGEEEGGVKAAGVGRSVV